MAKEQPRAILLREKDLSEAEYAALARDVLEICQRHHVACILHNFSDMAADLGAEALQLPLPELRRMEEGKKARYRELGASCHSIADAVEAEGLGCTYIIAGHIFETDCKKGVPPRGLDFLSEVCRAVKIPVYAIGGIQKDNIASVRAAGARGGCVMSGWMTCEDVGTYMEEFQNG